MPQTQVPEEQERAQDIAELKEIYPTPNRTVTVDNVNGEPTLYLWDANNTTDSNEPDVVKSNEPGFGDGETNEGAWLKIILPFPNADTDDLSEGSGNLYHTDERAITAVENESSLQGLSFAQGSQLDFSSHLSNNPIISGPSNAAAALYSADHSSVNIDLDDDNTDSNGVTALRLRHDGGTQYAELRPDEFVRGGNTVWDQGNDGVLAKKDQSQDISGQWTFTTIPEVNNESISPSNSTDFVTKAYADSIAQSLQIKDAVRLASAGNSVDLTATSWGGTLDNVGVNDGDRVLLKDQSSNTDNGIYVANTAADPSSWTRAADFDEDVDIVEGSFVFVEDGASQSGDSFVVTNDSPSLANGTVWSQFSSAGAIQAGDGLSRSGETLSVDVSDFAGTGLQSDGASPANLAIVDSAVQDAVFDSGVLSGNTTSLITVAYQTGDNTVDFTVQDDLSQYDNSVSGFTTYDSSDFDTDFGNKTTDDLSEGGTNLYYTDERAQDAVNSLLNGGTKISTSYDDGGDTLTINFDGLEVEDNGTDQIGGTVQGGAQALNFGSYLDTSLSGSEVTIDSRLLGVQTDGTDLQSQPDKINFTGDLSAGAPDGNGVSDITLDSSVLLDVQNSGTDVVTDAGVINFESGFDVNNDNGTADVSLAGSAQIRYAESVSFSGDDTTTQFTYQSNGGINFGSGQTAIFMPATDDASSYSHVDVGNVQGEAQIYFDTPPPSGTGNIVFEVIEIG